MLTALKPWWGFFLQYCSNSGKPEEYCCKKKTKFDKTTQITGKDVIDCWCHEGDAQVTSSRIGSWVSRNILNQPFCPPPSSQAAQSEIFLSGVHTTKVNSNAIAPSMCAVALSMCAGNFLQLLSRTSKHVGVGRARFLFIINNSLNFRLHNWWEYLIGRPS